MRADKPHHLNPNFFSMVLCSFVKMKVLLCMISFLGGVFALAGGKMNENTPLSMPITWMGVRQRTSVTIDGNWRWLRFKDNYDNCFSGQFNTKYCPDPLTCSDNCIIEGAGDYKKTYGVSVSGNALTLDFVTVNPYGTNIGSRMYMLDPSGSRYLSLHLLDKEFVFTVDVSNLPCGLNGAVYLTELPQRESFPGSAAYGVGYGDAQSPKDIKYIDGYVNTNRTGAASSEYDIWEANSRATQTATHICKNVGVYGCRGSECLGICDKPGADMNRYRQGDKTLYGRGPSFSVDTTRPFQVITQFITDKNGDLFEIRRFYKQDGKTIAGGVQNDATATAQHIAFGEKDTFKAMGGMRVMGQSFKRGMMLSLSLWDDSSSARMRWLDGTYPFGSNAPGAERGPCHTEPKDPSVLRSKFPKASVTYSDIQIRSINGVDPEKEETVIIVPAQEQEPAQCSNQPWAQCDGVGFLGVLCCPKNYKCVFNSKYYSQCLPDSSADKQPTPRPRETPPPTEASQKWVCTQCLFY